MQLHAVRSWSSWRRVECSSTQCGAGPHGGALSRTRRCGSDVGGAREQGRRRGEHWRGRLTLQDGEGIGHALAHGIGGSRLSRQPAARGWEVLPTKRPEEMVPRGEDEHGKQEHEQERRWGVWGSELTVTEFAQNISQFYFSCGSYTTTTQTVCVNTVLD